MNGRHARSLALFALLLAPALTLAQTRRDRVDAQYGYSGGAAGPAIGALGGGLMVGLDIPPSGLDVGPRFTGELMYGTAQLAPQLRADLGARLAFAYHGFSGGGGNQWLLDVVPDLRLLLAVSDKLAIYGDVGVGFSIIRTNVDFAGSATDTEATFQLTVPGLSYALSPSLNLLAELRFNFYTRSGDGTFITIPNIGLQWH
jgi:opacity protein-like surface antigen